MKPIFYYTMHCSVQASSSCRVPRDNRNRINVHVFSCSWRYLCVYVCVPLFGLAFSINYPPKNIEGRGWGCGMQSPSQAAIYVLWNTKENKMQSTSGRVLVRGFVTGIILH